MSENYQQNAKAIVVAGKRSLQSLRLARKSLSSAGVWKALGIGIGLFGLIGKASKREEAERRSQQACVDLKSLQDQLRNVDSVLSSYVDTRDFMAFVDCFEGFITQWLMQSQFKNAKQLTDTAIQKVEGLLKNLQIFVY